MNNTNFIELNKFSVLNNEDNIFFCKTDFLFDDFNTISKLNKNVILITGNSDYAITDDIVKIAPKNIAAWYAQNALSNHSFLIPIPIGLENKLPSVRNGHGIGYFERGCLREKLLSEYSDRPSNKLIYANFNISTSIEYRSAIKDICQKCNHIEWENPGLSLNELYRKYQDYKMILCPAGNGVDTHRLWEALYCNKIPITIKTGNFKLYELYNRLPILMLDDMLQLRDEQYIISRYNTIVNNKKQYNTQMLYTNFWIESILSHKDI